MLIALVRLVTAQTGHALLQSRHLRDNIAIIGTGVEAQFCARLIRADQHGAVVAGFVPSGLDCVDQPLAQVAELQQLIQSFGVRDVVVATSEQDRARLPELIQSLRCLPVRVLLWPGSIGIEPGWIAASSHTIGDAPLIVASVPPLDGWRWILKDVRDRLLALLLLIVLSPLLLVTAAMIRLSSPGPILFRQEREGYNGRRFMILKFRTMYLTRVTEGELKLTAKDDPRIFPVGAILRKTSLDELPQLINVLRGDMWLIGPRPHSPLATAAGQRYSAVVRHYTARFRVKPGITGLAQVNGCRGPTNTVEQIQQRVAYDLHYIENLSLWLDLRILLQTAVKGFVHPNAY